MPRYEEAGEYIGRGERTLGPEGGYGQGLINEAVKKSEGVGLYISEISSKLHELHDRLSKLEAVLDPVLVPPFPEKESVPQVSRMATLDIRSAYTNQLNEASDSIGCFINRLNMLTRRVQL